MLVPGDPRPDLPDIDAGPIADTPRRGRFRLDNDARSEAAEHRRLEQDLRHALAQGQFVLHFQPRVALASGRPLGAEALIRWPHRKRGMVSPATFLPAAERSGLITRIGAWTIQSACAEALNWPSRCTVSVNISARQLADAALLDQLAGTLDESGLAPDRLELEMTEAILVDVSLDTLLTLSGARDLGIGLVLDDFGTGYASLSILKRLPLTVLKLDRSLVRGLPEDREDQAIARSVIEAAHALGLTVVAEGIETEAQREFLVEAGCDEGQGYLFSHPLPTERLRSRLIG